MFVVLIWHNRTDHFPEYVVGPFPSVKAAAIQMIQDGWLPDSSSEDNTGFSKRAGAQATTRLVQSRAGANL